MHSQFESESESESVGDRSVNVDETDTTEGREEIGGFA